MSFLSQTDVLLSMSVRYVTPLLSSSDRVWVRPHGNPAVLTSVWERLREALDIALVRCYDVRTGVGVTSPLLGAFSPQEQRTFGRASIYLGSDATNTGDEVDTAGAPLSGVMFGVSYSDKA
jgi:hypothetical protein